MNELYSLFRTNMRRIADLNSFLALGSWDQEIYMPEKGAAFRAQQLSTLSGIVHEMLTDKDLAELIDKLLINNDLDFVEKRNVRETFRVLTKKKKLPVAFVEKESKAISEAYEAWMLARSKNDFKIFLPKLKEIISIQREKAELYGYEEHPYDALLDDYEPGLTTTRVEEVFMDVKETLVPLIQKISTLPQPDESILHNTFEEESQLSLCRKIITELGYDWDSGRLDLSAHPFSISMSPNDARITTRVNENDLQECIWGGMHETGHAFYELGLPASEYGLPSGSAASLAIHESQSRLWENNVGKSMPFINAIWEDLKSFFPNAFSQASAQDFFAALNTIKPNLIRINSDEVTYHLHILLRFEIEKGLIEGSIPAEALEDIWNEKIKSYLNLEVPSPKMGVLQDIHWSHGSFGYFPTYSMGSFYAAQFFHFAKKAMPDIENKIQQKDFASLLQWLRDNIHKYGHTFTPEELCEKVCGEGLNFKYFNDYIHTKFEKIYAL